MTDRTPRSEDQDDARRGRHIDVSNFHFLQYRKVDGFLVTAKNSGTHWLRFQLSCALAEQFHRPPPALASGDASDDDLGHPRRPPRWPEPPRIGSSHNLPSRLIGSRALRSLVAIPPTVVLVRDLKDALLSFYVKWRETYGVELSEFVAGDPTGARYKADVWWFIQFFNRWGEIAHRWPAQTLVVRYEDLLTDPAEQLRRIGRHWGVDFTEAAIAAGLAAAGRDRMAGQLDPAKTAVMSDQEARARILYTPADLAVLDAILARRLKWNFGYAGLPTNGQAATR